LVKLRESLEQILDRGLYGLESVAQFMGHQTSLPRHALRCQIRHPLREIRVLSQESLVAFVIEQGLDQHAKEALLATGQILQEGSVEVLESKHPLLVVC
jgi:hypothetical protein